MPPVCSNCGATEFVWANDLKTGSMGRGSLSLRRGGELSLGTRICRTCGHADLFVKDPGFLRQPHTWKPGEFVPIAPKPTVTPTPAPRSEPMPPTPSPPSPGTPPPPTPEPIMPVPYDAASPAQSAPAGSPAAPAEDAATEPAASPEESTPKKSTRRRSSKSKPPATPPSS